jgi:lysophospholipid acyltransferase (LPLAT)-like uncharacterized protein
VAPLLERFLSSRALAWIVSGLVRALAGSWRVRRCARATEALQGPAVIALLHGELLPLLGTHLDRGVVVLVSRSRDGERLARILEGLGYVCVRGSSSRGALSALRAARRALAVGRVLAVAVDGPRGPAGSVAPGVFALARHAPLWAARAQAPGARLPTWDRACVPWPFASVRVHFARVQGEGGETSLREAWASFAPTPPVRPRADDATAHG